MPWLHHSLAAHHYPAVLPSLRTTQINPSPHPPHGSIGLGPLERSILTGDHNNPLNHMLTKYGPAVEKLVMKYLGDGHGEERATAVLGRHKDYQHQGAPMESSRRQAVTASGMDELMRTASVDEAEKEQQEHSKLMVGNPWCCCCCQSGVVEV